MLRCLVTMIAVRFQQKSIQAKTNPFASYYWPILRACTSSWDANVLSTMPCCRVDVLRFIWDICERCAMAQRHRPHTARLHACVVRRASYDSDTEPLPERLSNIIGPIHLHRVYNTSCIPTGTMLRRDHTERYVFIRHLCMERSLYNSWRAKRYDVDLHTGALNELADMLGYYSWQEILLRCSGVWLGNSSRALRS